MKKRIFEKVKDYFVFFNLSDKELMDMVNKTFDESLSEEDNFDKILNIFYKVVSDSYKKGDISLILLSNKFSYDSYSSAIESLNNFSLFLNNCGIKFNIELENKIKSESKDLDGVLKRVSESNDDYIDKLNGFSIEVLNNSSYSEINDLEEDEELNFEEIDFTDDAIRQYKKEIGKISLLSEEEKNTLFKLYSETKDPKIRKRIIEANLRLVFSIAVNYSKISNSLSLLDLISMGNEGLIRALDTYDQEKASFSTYATTWIKQKILKGISESSDSIKIPLNKKHSILKFHKLKDKLEAEYGRVLSSKELSELTNLSVETICEYEIYYHQLTTISMDAPIGEEEDSNLIEFIQDKDSMNPEQTAIFNDVSNVKFWLSYLNDTEKMIILLKTGLYDGKEYNLEEISLKLKEFGLRDKNLSRQRIEQIESRALRRLKRIIEVQRKKEEDKKEEQLKEKETLKKVKSKSLLDELSKHVESNNINSEFLKLVKLIRITEVTVLARSIYEMPPQAKTILEKCFGKNILAGNPLATTADTKREAVYIALPLLRKIIKKNEDTLKIQRLEDVVLPRNLYVYFKKYSQDDVDRAIEKLSSTDRLSLSRCYDMYTGDYNSESKLPLLERRDISNVLKIIDYNLPRNKKRVKRK